MKYLKVLLLLIPSFVFAQNKKNILFICIDDLRPELASFGATYIHSPNIDQLAKQGRVFQNHYVNAPSCGPSRFTLLTGTYGPPQNDALFLRSEKMSKNSDSFHKSMPEWFRANGYTTVSVGKVSHHPGGRGGRDWNDENVIEMPNAWDRHLMPVAEWKHPRGAMHGLANGEIRGNNVKMEVFQAVDGADTQYPDGHTVNEALNQIDILTADQTKPFFLAVGILKPHLPFGAPKKYLDLYEGVKLPEIVSPEKPAGVSTWHNSNEFRQYNLWNKDPNEDKAFALEVRKHYAACVSYADAQVGKIIEKLKETNADKNTIIVLWGDHGWNLGEHGIWGKHNLFNEALHSPLIISYPELKKKGQKAMGIVETLDIFPTLCDLTEIEKPDFVQGKSLKPFLNNPKTKGHVAYSYLNAVHSIKTEKYRFIQHDNLELELYDHKTDPHERKNIAANEPKKVAELKKILAEKMAISNWAKGELK